MNIHEVIEYGPIVAHDEELDILITVNGAYFNLWVGADFTSTPSKGRQWTNTEAYDMESRVRTPADMAHGNGLYGLDITVVMDAAEELLAEILEGDGEE